MKTISERIKYIRLNAAGKKLSQDDFGQSLGLSRGVIANLEDAENRLPNGIPDSTIKLICATYHVSYKWLTEGVGPMFEAASGDALIDRYAPDAEEHLKAALRVMSALPEESLVALRDYVDDLFRAAEQMRRDGE